jgi:hypothetical protein
MEHAVVVSVVLIRCVSSGILLVRSSSQGSVYSTSTLSYCIVNIGFR